MATLELTITPEYVNWNLWEAVREIAQNAADEDDKGNTMAITHHTGKGVKIGGEYQEGVLEFRNVGSSLSREQLLMGGTTKRGDSLSRGQFGEGMKLAWASLLRLGHRVWIRTGAERWVPELGHSATFDAELLKVKTAKTKGQGDVLVQIQGVSEEDWAIIRSRLLFIEKPADEDVIDLGDTGRILTGEQYRGSLYVKGIYVCKLPDRYHFGYDLRHVKIDRDRRLADPWTLKTQVREAIMTAVQKDLVSPELALEVLDDQGCGEAKAFDSEQYWSKTDFHTKVAAAFVQVHGEDAAPVTSMGDSLEAKHHGMKGIVVTESLRKVVEKELGDFEERKVKSATDVQLRYTADDIGADELNNLVRAVELVASAEKNVSLDNVQVVDFVGERILGVYSVTEDGEVVLISWKILQSRGRLVTALIHEFAHRYGDDGSVEHRDAIDRIAGDIMESYCWG